MKFVIDEAVGEVFYWIEVENIAQDDETIAKMLYMSVEQYRAELLQFISDKIVNSQYTDNYIGDDVIFINIEEALSACNYLNEKYAVFLTLWEK